MNPTSNVFGWAILAATFLGPICAVLVTRYIDERRDTRQRRLHIFRALMGTRRAQLAPEHIGALNLIEIDYRGCAGVLSAWGEYLRNLGTIIDERNANQTFRARQNLFVKLLSEMAKVLNLKIEQLEIFEGGYFPQASVDLEAQQAAIRKLFTEISEGKRALPISNFDKK